MVFVQGRSAWLTVFTVGDDAGGRRAKYWAAAAIAAVVAYQLYPVVVMIQDVRAGRSPLWGVPFEIVFASWCLVAVWLGLAGGGRRGARPPLTAYRGHHKELLVGGDAKTGRANRTIAAERALAKGWL